ncbi:hypothetical protein HV265_11890 [Citrobacter sp. RHBSTW-00678]|nr:MULTISPECIES: hypothetical protein [Enterobacterales]EHW4861360.1 hypothetical protein [Escherichia coli]HAT2746135.1 hypothetical protein [Citrobacter farmeri]EJS0492820.1 hypothetical protein [Escherichia coli]MBA7758869.1 hypothetical protein [Citrobacter sp. RHBSTW-00325]MDM2998634.1 hypothetical protein [Citrobacter sp. CK192]
MMKMSEAVDAVNNSGNRALLDIAFDKLRNNFYGYVLTSLLFFNLENIILIIKSKNPIEMTLIYIGLQKEFSWDFFWVPIFYGMLASVIMPIITAIYALIIGVIKAIRDDSGTFGSVLWTNIKLMTRSYQKKEEKIRDELNDEIDGLVTRRDAEYSRIKAAEIQREGLEEYLRKLAGVYGVYNNNNSERNLVGFLNEIDKADIAKHFPNPQLLNDLLMFVQHHANQKTGDSDNKNNNSNIN